MPVESIGSLCTGPDLGVDSTGALRVTAARLMPEPAAITAYPSWTNGLRQDGTNGAWAAQCAPTPVNLVATSTTTVQVAAGASVPANQFVIPDFIVNNPSAVQNLAFLGDVQFDATIYTNGSIWGQMYAYCTYIPYPGTTAVSSSILPQETTAPATPITPAQAAAGSQSFLWHPQAKVGLGLWCGPKPGKIDIGISFSVTNQADNAPSTPFPLVVASWQVTLTGVMWLIDPTPVT